MTLRAKLVLLVLAVTAAILAGVGLSLSRSWARWAAEAVAIDLSDRAEDLARAVELKDGELELEDAGERLASDPSHPVRLAGGGLALATGDLPWPPEGDGLAAVTDAAGRTWQVRSQTFDVHGDHGRTARLSVQVAGLSTPFGSLEGRFRRGLLLALLAALVLGGGGAALLAGAGLAPLERLAGEVDGIGAESLDRRVGEGRLDPELRRLAGAFNRLLSRLDEAMRRQRAFVARASHALRTPTAAILTRAEVALRRERSAAEYREALADVAASARESSALVDHLLTLARLEEQARPLAPERVELGEAAGEVCRALGARAAEAGLALACEVPAGLAARADRAALKELLEALLDNALRYTPRGGRAGVSAAPAAAGVALTIWDTGPGIPPAERGQAFDRFRRGSASEASGAPGSGLGLAIVKAIADAHGAPIALGDREGGGLAVTVTLPAA